MVRLLVEEARHALPPPHDAQCERDAGPVPSTSNAGALPRIGSVRRPHSVIQAAPLAVAPSQDGCLSSLPLQLIQMLPAHLLDHLVQFGRALAEPDQRFLADLVVT